MEQEKFKSILMTIPSPSPFLRVAPPCLFHLERDLAGMAERLRSGDNVQGVRPGGSPAVRSRGNHSSACASAAGRHHKTDQESQRCGPNGHGRRAPPDRGRKQHKGKKSAPQPHREPKKWPAPPVAGRRIGQRPRRGLHGEGSLGGAGSG